ncbi:hypothetical protein FRC11_005837, partial [Ceratobasidium sp. 423]
VCDEHKKVLSDLVYYWGSEEDHSELRLRCSTTPEDDAVQATPSQAQSNANPSNTHNRGHGKEPQELPLDSSDRHAQGDKLGEIGEKMNDPSNTTNPTDSELQVGMFLMLANACRSDYQSSGILNSLEQAINAQHQALLLVEDRNLIKPGLLDALGISLSNRFERLGKLADLNEAIEYWTRAVNLTPDSRAARPGYLNNLGLSWWKRYHLLGDHEDLDRAIAYQTQVMQLAAEDHPDKPGFLNNLGNSWMSRFRLLGDTTDINKAITYQTQAVGLAPQGYPHKAVLLNNLGSSMFCRYARLGDSADLDKEIEFKSQAVQLTPEIHPNKPAFLSSLGHSLFHRYERLGNLVDLDKAIEYKSQAIQSTPQHHLNKPDWLNTLGRWEWCRFERAGRLTDVDKAIEHNMQAIRLTPETHKSRPQYLSDLGCSRMRRFERVGDLSDLDRAIEHQTQAIQLTPEGHKYRAEYLCNLGHSLRRRFERLDDLADVDKAIRLQQLAVHLIPEGQIDKHIALMNLGCSWSSRFQRLEQPADIDKAIEYQAEAVRLAPDNHPDKQMYLNSLGHSWARRSVILGEPAGLDKAIQCQTEAVQLTPEDHPDKPRNLNNLGNSFAYRYSKFGNLTDLDKDIEYHAHAVRLTPEGHRGKPDHLHNLGDALVRRFAQLGQRADLESARISFQRGAELVVTNPETQIKCARKWGDCALRLDISPLEACQRSFALIPHLVWVGMTIQDRYRTLTQISDFASQAASWAVSVQYYDLAIEWLEEGRSIVWNQILQLRTPFDDLAVADPGLASRFKGIASELEGAGLRTKALASGTSIESQLGLEHQAHHHRHLAAQWELLLAEARQLPGLNNFLRPRKIEELREAASTGPLVIINTHPSRCDALIIFPGHEDVVHIPLDRFSQTKAVECRAQMLSLIGHRGDGDKARGFKRYSKIVNPREQLRPLVVLWLDVVGPVLDALACTRKLPDHELPHITWCATGALSFLPLHAAGPYDGLSPNAFDLVVSSYTPTLSALLSRSTHTAETHAGVLAVGQANTPGLSRLPKTVEELEIVKKYTGTNPFQQLDGTQATIDATLSAMEAHCWVHLACHATQNRVNPSQSAFYLHDGELTLEAITKRAFKNKGLAFLSACQTATGDDELPDEATHLAAGMLMAGYPSVIATMWSIMDDDAPEITEEVYAELIQDENMDHTNAARALHKAVGKLREKVGLESVGRWAPFVHIGA